MRLLLLALVAITCAGADARMLLQTPQSFTGNIAVRLVHKGKDHAYALDFYEGEQSATRVVLDVPDMPAAGPPSSFYTGVAVTFKGTYNADKTRISLNSFKDIIILSNPSTSQGNLGGPLRSFKVLHVLARFPNTVDGGVTVQQQQTAYSNLASMWSQCSNNFLTFDTSSKVVGPVELPTTNFSVCPSDALFNTWMSTALDYARAQGINPADYPYHAFTWPQEIQRTCGWAGLAYVSCYNNSNGGTPCWAMYMAPYSADNRILMHETGHNIGLSHARIWGNSNEYSDQTDPMGGGNFGCYNAPHSYQLGWQAPSVVGANNLPVGGVLSRTISAPSRINASPINTGVLVNVKSWNSGVDNVFLQFLLQEAGYSNFGITYSLKTAVYRWAGVSFFSWDKIPAYVSSMADSTIVDLPDLTVAVRQVSNNGASAVVQICRYASAASSCNWNAVPSPPQPPPQPSPSLPSPRPASPVPSSPKPPVPSPSPKSPKKKATLSMVLFSSERFTGQRITLQADWDPTTPGTCWGVPNLSIWGWANKASSLQLTVECSDNIDNCAQITGTYLARVSADINYLGTNQRINFPANPTAFCNGNGRRCSGYLGSLNALSKQVDSLRICIGGAAPTMTVPAPVVRRQANALTMLSDVARTNLAALRSDGTDVVRTMQRV